MRVVVAATRWMEEAGFEGVDVFWARETCSWAVTGLQQPEYGYANVRSVRYAGRSLAARTASANSLAFSATAS